MTATEEKTSSDEKVNQRPGYVYSASFGSTSPGAPTADQCVWVKLEISGQIKIVAVCALCHKAFRLCSLDPNVTEEQIASAKYLGLTNTSTDDKEGVKEDIKESTEAEKSDNDADKKEESSDSSKTKNKSQSDSAKKKKKRSDGGSDQRRKELPQTSWTTNKP